LVEKKVMYGTKSKIIREEEYRLLNDPSNAESKELKVHYQKCQDRLNRILIKEGDRQETSIPKDEVQTFEAFCDKVTQWSNEKDSYVFFRDDGRVKGKNVLAQRSQLSGLCYIHGPDMLQHYLVSMKTGQFAGMIDISKLIRDSFTAKQLEDHIFNDYGGSSETLLEFILQPNSVICTTDIKVIEARLKKFGPLLVAKFRVHEDFYNSMCP